MFPNRGNTILIRKAVNDMLIKLIKKHFSLWVQMRWIKDIDRETEKLRKLQFKCNVQKSVLGALIKEYEKLYPNERLKGE